MSIMGAVIALAIAIAFVSVIHRAAAVEAAPVTTPATAPVIAPQPLINRPQPFLSEPDAHVKDREQLRKYFLQDSPGRLRR